MQMTQIAMALGHLHANRVVHGHVHPVSSPPSIILFPLPHSHLKAVIRIKNDGNATLTHTGAYTAASRVLHSYTRSIPPQESFAYHAPEFVRMEGPGVPTEEMDVYAFGSTLYTVHLTVIIMKYFLLEAHETLLEGLYRHHTI